ncbi:MAG: SDR family oxidoreductase [Phycisphaerales bacterium]
MSTEQHRTFVITGGTKGIGLATARAMASQGHRVIGLARSAASEFPGEVIAADLSNSSETAEVARTLAARRVDGLVNNVGLVRPSIVGEIVERDLHEVLDLNLRPALTITQALLPQLRERRWGRIVNVTSLAVLGIRQRTAYSAAKAALGSFTRTWALELATEGITVNAVAPGPTETELFRENTPKGSEAERRFKSLVPMQRIASPGEIAAAIAFLLHEDASYITGQTLYVDGGASIGRAPA